MKPRLFTALFALCCAPLLAQAPAAAPAIQTHTSDVGFTYGIPADWEVVDAQPIPADVKLQATQSTASETDKKGIACVQIALNARHGDPASAVTVVVLPFDCMGQQMGEKDLPGFAAGASEGIKKTFDISEPTYGAYSLGTHSLWVERATGSLIGHSEVKYTIETVCSVLKKGAVCWMALAADDSGLQTFEKSTVTLDGEAAAALVPAAAFQKKP